ncbi:50S ribosomal protein L7/L12 [Candidatus Phytoplasma pini]|uniref:Large ribosomal subunit protein bL12 n=1 Tax=Candidatus Phytoplasma pini TaxID=267362 RepID=A0A559KJJ1_9MOLU|nr:50S ribosomal protein L7/L12 [Candidatus Phytoplasma pini]TVY12296.1 50S ribosomal protein L7/L12 [Candidatus Phytoplasma pini]
MAKITKKDFIESLREMTLLDIKELLDGLKEEFGIDPTNFVATVSQNLETKEEQEEQTEFKVILKKINGSRAQVIKEIAEITKKSLLESKQIIDDLSNGDVLIKENMNKKDAEYIKQKLESLDAVIELK